MSDKKKGLCAIILARGGSKRIPKKNIAPFAGAPLLAWSIRQARAATCVETVYVSTDDSSIAAVARAEGARVIERPAEISGDLASGEIALEHALLTIQKERPNDDYAVFLQPTSPLREASDIDHAVAEARRQGLDSLFSGAETGDFYMWRHGTNGNLESLNYDYKNRKRSQDFETQYVENGSIYVFKPEVLLGQHNRLGGAIGVSLMEFWKSFEIDTPEGLVFCEQLFKLKGLDKK